MSTVDLVASELFVGFGSPYEPINDIFLNQVVLESSRTTTARFLEKNETLVRRVSGELVDAVDRWSTEELPEPSVGYDPAFGDAYRCVGTVTDEKVISTIVALGIHLAAHGRAMEWNAAWATPRTLRWPGLLFADATAVNVEAASDRATVRIDTSTGDHVVHHLTLDGGRWRSDREDRPDTECTIDVGLPVRNAELLPRRALGLYGDLDHIITVALEHIHKQEAELVQAAYE